MIQNKLVQLTVILCASCSASACHPIEECDPASSQRRCSGDSFDQCVVRGDTWARGNFIETVDCRSLGARCVDRGGEAACVDPALSPCSGEQSRCSLDGSAIQRCVLGYLATSTACRAGDRCVERDGQPECATLAGLGCTGTGELCSPDGRSVLRCHDGQAYQRGWTCTADELCVAVAGKAGCVDRSLVRCDSGSWRACSRDSAAIWECQSELGYYRRTSRCAADQRCIDYEQEIPCDGTQPVCGNVLVGPECLVSTGAPCTTEGLSCQGSQILLCATGTSYLHRTCSAGEVCASRGAFADCVNASLTPCRAEEQTCSSDGAAVLGCDPTTGYLQRLHSCGGGTCVLGQDGPECRW
jgi:hypothetical protein